MLIISRISIEVLKSFQLFKNLVRAAVCHSWVQSLSMLLVLYKRVKTSLRWSTNITFPLHYLPWRTEPKPEWEHSKKRSLKSSCCAEKYIRKRSFSKLLVGTVCTTWVRINAALKRIGVPRLLFLFIFWDGFAAAEHAGGSKGMLRFPPRAALRSATAGAGNILSLHPSSFHPSHLLSLISF